MKQVDYFLHHAAWNSSPFFFWEILLASIPSLYAGFLFVSHYTEEEKT